MQKRILLLSLFFCFSLNANQEQSIDFVFPPGYFAVADNSSYAHLQGAMYRRLALDLLMKGLFQGKTVAQSLALLDLKEVRNLEPIRLEAIAIMELYKNHMRTLIQNGLLSAEDERAWLDLYSSIMDILNNPANFGIAQRSFVYRNGELVLSWVDQNPKKTVAAGVGTVACMILITYFARTFVKNRAVNDSSGGTGGNGGGENLGGVGGNDHSV